jgi:hypothetical protein
MEIA